MIHIAIGIHDPRGEYSCHAGAMLASLFLHTSSPVCAHILHDDTLTENNKRNFFAIARRFGKEISFYQVSIPDSIGSLAGHVTQGALFRLLLPEMIDTDKIIYFDCDIIVTMDICQLWEIDLQDFPVAAVLDPGIPNAPEAIKQKIQCMGIALQSYFNSGVMVMNLRLLRQHMQLFKQATDYLKQWPESVFHDQDALNWLFQQHYLKLDTRYNKIIVHARMAEFHEPAVWHFAGVKPWEYYESSLDMLYWKAVCLTPWRGRLFEDMAKAIDTSFSKFFEKMNKDKLAYDVLAKKCQLIQKNNLDTKL